MDFKLIFFKLSDATIKNVFMIKKIINPGEAELEVHRVVHVHPQILPNT